MKAPYGLLLFALAVPAFADDAANAPALPHKLIRNWAQLPDGWNFGEASGVTVDKYDNVWVFNRGAHQVIQFDKTGRFLRGWKDVPALMSHGIKADANDNIWLVDVRGHSVAKFDMSGRLQMIIANAGRGPGDNQTKYAFNQPTGLTFRPDGGFYVSDGYGNSRVAQFSADGVFLRQWGKKGTGDGEFDLVHDVTLDKSGKVYVADRNNHRIQVFDAEGRFLAKWTGIGSPWGLAYSAKESAMYMCDGENNRVLKLDMNGKVLGVLGGFGKAPGLFDFPHHMAIDSEGALYVVEIKNWRVQKFVP